MPGQALHVDLASRSRLSWAGRGRALLMAALAVALLPWLAGCVTTSASDAAPLASYRPGNVYQVEPQLAPELRRVAVLPLMAGSEEGSIDFGCDTLAPLLSLELAKAQKFELVNVTPEQLRLWTGRSRWSGEETLPLDFFERLREALTCDAVLFSRLTLYHAYEPQRVGWRLKLLDAEEPRILWSVDEVFDASNPAIARAAQQFAAARPGRPADRRAVLQSPRRFGEYTAHAVVATLPAR